MRNFLGFGFLFLVCGCSASSDSFSAPSSSSEGSGSSSPSPSPSQGSGGAPSGTLTAGAWDDNRNYDFFEKYLANEAQLPGFVDVPKQERDAARDRFAVRGPKAKLDVALVIDVTGSMGDEIAYIRSEFSAIASSIASAFPNSEQRWGLVVYRDTVDTFISKKWDFTSNTATFQGEIDPQQAGGGGDYPESPEVGLKDALDLSWRSDPSVARMIFWVADAPHHADKAPDMLADMRRASQLDVHVYPVAASGADDLTEVTMRSSAQLSGGRYLFLTDDSGVDDTHKEPIIPCYFVTKLDKAIVRMVSIELSGQYREPDPADIIRTGGDPKNGQCTLSSGLSANVF